MPLRRDPPTGPPVYRRVVGCVTLDLTDIENIVRVLRERTAEVRIQAGDATADAAADLADATPHELRRVVISSSSPVVRVALGIAEASVSTPENTGEARKVVDDAVWVLSQRTSAGARVRAIWYPIWLAIWLIQVSIIAVISNNSPLAYLIWAFLLPGYIVVRRNFRHLSMNGFATVIPEARGQRRRVSRDMRRNILIGLLIAVFSVFLTVLVTSHVGSTSQTGHPAPSSTTPAAQRSK